MITALRALTGRGLRSHRRRLTANLERVMAGKSDRLADNLDSYHTVWFHLHDDLLATLGLERCRPSTGVMRRTRSLAPLRLLIHGLAAL